MSATADLAQFVADIRADQLPQSVDDIVGQCLSDFIAVAALGARVDSSQPILESLAELGGVGQATVIGRSAGATAEHAALLNGTFAHSLDFDDTNIAATLHPGAPVLAAVLAAAELADADGAQVVAGIVAGYETTCRIGRALGEAVYDRGFHPTAIAGTFGAAVGAARTFGMDPARIDAAMGAAGSMASGSMQFLSNGSWNKRLHAGLAARNGLSAAVLAGRGFRSSDRSIEGRAGAIANFSGQGDVAELTRELGEDWLLLRTGFKPYPSCRLTHSAVDLCIDIRRDLGRAPLPDEGVEITISPRADSIVGGDQPNKVRPVSVVDAQFSVRFQCAIALLDGEVRWSSYDDLERSDLVDLAERVDLVVDPSFGSAEANARVRRADTIVADVHRTAPRGESGDPANPSVIETKLRQAGAGLWSAERLEQIVALAGAPRKLPDARAWMPLLRPSEAA